MAHTTLAKGTQFLPRGPILNREGQILLNNISKSGFLTNPTEESYEELIWYSCYFPVNAGFFSLNNDANL